MSTPLKNIAISLSGGGYRAAAFHLGTLSLLDSIKTGENERTLLDELYIISTISGGTFTGLILAYSEIDSKSFEWTFKKLYLFLKEDKLVKNALRLVNSNKEWKNKTRSRNVINAFAEIYDKEFFKGKTFDSIQSGKYIFNATDMSNGLGFRFQKEGEFGNKYFNTAKSKNDRAKNNAEIKKIKLGDILAASSCFPAGFEPLIMPKDFSIQLVNAFEKNDKNTKQIETEPLDKICLMDGGIVDNHGFRAVQLADNRLKNQNKKNPEVKLIGTYIVSSVESKIISPYKAPQTKSKLWLGKLSLMTFRNLSVLIMFLSLGGLLISKFQFNQWSPNKTYLVLFISTLFFTLSIVAQFVLNSGRKRISQFILDIFKKNEISLIKEFEIIEKIDLNTLFDLLKIRTGSFISIAMNVFMRQIRRLQFEEIFGGRIWKNRSVSNFFYDLLDDKVIQQNQDWKKIVSTANKMKTTLWFTDKNKQEDMLNNLVKTGQLTMCYNLIEYIEKKLKFKDRNDDYIKNIHDNLKATRDSLLIDSNFLMKNYLPKKDLNP